MAFDYKRWAAASCGVVSTYRWNRTGLKNCYCKAKDERQPAVATGIVAFATARIAGGGTVPSKSDQYMPLRRTLLALAGSLQ